MSRQFLRLKHLPLSPLLVYNLFLITFFFQIYLISQLKLFYPLIKICFLIEMLLLVIALAKTGKKEKWFVLCILVIVAMRIPFYLNAEGLLITSDNAIEPLQSLEIRSDHTVPFYLFETQRHIGTLRFLFIAFIWDFLGESFLYVSLCQLAFFIVFLYLIYAIFQTVINIKILMLFIFVNFAFIEVFFDYSLLLGAGPYLEMLVFFLIGVKIFDFEFKNGIRIFLSCYFLLFSIYLHPIGLIFAGAFLLCTLIYAAKSHCLLRNLKFYLTGFFVGGFHLIYYQLFITKPPPVSDWNLLVFLSPSNISLRDIPFYCVKTVTNFMQVFTNLFSYEFSFYMEFAERNRQMESILAAINTFLIYLSLFIFLIALALVIKKLISLKKLTIRRNDWFYLFFLLLFLAVLFKIFLLIPRPFLMPRHNLDLAFLIVMGFLLVFSTLFPMKKIMSLKFFSAALLLFVFASPHYYSYLQTVISKKRSYHEILNVLNHEGVKNLCTDGTIAYSIFYLAKKNILVSDSMGPVTIPFYYPEMKRKIDNLPLDEKAHLLYSERNPRKAWHKRRTREIERSLLKKLRKEHLDFQIIDVNDYVLIIPHRKTDFAQNIDMRFHYSEL